MREQNRDTWLEALARASVAEPVSRRAFLRRAIGLAFGAAAVAAELGPAAGAIAAAPPRKLKCPPSDLICNGRCVNTATDTSNCGRCGHACKSGAHCANGVCVNKTCPKGLTLCSGKCVKLTAHPQHCGTCGYRCPAGGRCAKGKCVH